MAITLVGSYVGGTASVGSATTVTFSSTMGITVLTGDLVVVAYATEAHSDVGPASALLPSTSGYTAAHTYLFQTGTNATDLLVSYKVMGGTPDTSVTFQSNVGAFAYTFVVYVFRGVDATTPIDVSTTTAKGTSTTNADCPAITPVTSGAWIMAVGAGGGNSSASSAYTAPTNMSSGTGYSRTTFINGGETSIIGASLYTAWASGSFDPNAYTGAQAASGTTYCAATLALRPIILPRKAVRWSYFL